MKADVTVKDVRLEDTANSGGSIGSLVANIDWTAAGDETQSIQNAIPLVGSFDFRRDDKSVSTAPSSWRRRSAAS